MSSAKTGRFQLAFILLATVALVSSTFASDPAKTQPPQASAALPDSSASQYAAIDVCKTCHEEIWEKHFSSTPHSALLKGNEHGCQSCHGPGQAHVDGGGDPTKIIRFETLSPSQTAAICSKCHQASLEVQNFSAPGQRRDLYLLP